MRLHDYLQRLQVDAATPPTLETLSRLHTAHRETFLFENLAIQSGGAISVDLPDIEQKFIDQHRGGYCFEHNTLFAAVLRQAGFAAVALLGRVRRGPPDRWARTHMVLRVTCADDDPGPYLADVGFGAVGLIEPMPLRDGARATQRGLTYTLRRDGPLWVLAMRDATQVMDLYEFAEEPQTVGDIIVANHYTSTHPESMFRKTLTIQRVRGNQRVILRNETLTRWDNGRMSEETIERARLHDVARELFEIELPRNRFVYEETNDTKRAT
jgi:N-hydroxyarylamine O-acetyltransferase